MRLPSQPKRTSARNKPLHFQYQGTEKGQRWEAYIAGPTWWGYLHMTRPSKPCVYELTAHAKVCRFCTGPKRVAVMKGWVPLYRASDGQPSCVPVDEVQRDELDGIATFAKVVVGREKNGGANVFIRAAVNQEPKWSSSLLEQSHPADVSCSLLNMWDVPELFDFFDYRRPSDSPVSLPEGTAVGADGKPFSPMMQAAAKRAGWDVVPTAADATAEAERDILRRAMAGGTAEPSPNGRHKLPPKG